MANILLVEDHPLMRPTLRDLLQLEGYTVLTAMHGREALEILDSNPSIDLVLTDFLMPEVNGISLVKQLRADGQYRNVPILMFTAHEEPKVQAYALEAGADMFLIRPISVPELLGAVRQLLERAKS